MENIFELLNKENAVLDCMLSAQQRLRMAVKQKNWVNLERILQNINSCSKQFSELDVKRDKIFASGVALSAEEKKLVLALHSKLLKVKMENKAMDAYVDATRNFIRGILDYAVPARRNVLYTCDGKILKRDAESVVVNKIL